MSIFSSLKPTSKAARNGFDLSRRAVFSNKAGIIRPCLALHTIPSSEYEIDMQQLMRTQPLQTAAFTGASINYDFVFCPYNHLYSAFNQFIAQRDYKNHATQPPYDSIPALSLGKYLGYLLPLAAYDYLSASVSDAAWHDTVYYLWEHEEYFCEAIPRFMYTLSNTPSYSACLSAVSQLDMLGYGNFLPVVKRLAFAFRDYLETMPAPQGVPNALCYRLLMWLDSFPSGVTPFTLAQDIVSNSRSYYYANYACYFEQTMNAVNGSYVSLWPALSYNKCFYEYYRNVYYDDVCSIRRLVVRTVSEQSDWSDLVSLDYVFLFNLDDNPDLSDISEGRFNRFVMMFAQKAHQYKKDMFTGVLPSTQFGNVSTMATDSDLAHKIYNIFEAQGSTSAIGTRGSRTVQTNVAPPSGTLYENFTIEPALAISVLEARKADAMQRFRERMMRAGNRTKDIFEAHGWSRPKSQLDYEPIFLGSFDGRLDINTVAATAPVGDVELGQLGANGVGVVSGSKVRFKSSDFGVILCIQYILKGAEYDAYGVDKCNTLLEPFDFPYPELQNISLVPISLENLNTITPVIVRSGTTPVYKTPADTILGYLPRSFEYKTAVDKIHGEFFSAPMGSENNYPSAREIVGVFSDWVTSRKDVRKDEATALSFHYQQIDVFDNVFKLAASSLPSDDHFLFNVQFDIKAVQPLPVIGLPI